MDSIFDAADPPLSGETLKRERAAAEARLRLWRLRFLSCFTALLLSFGFVYAFVDGRMLTKHDELIKQALLLLSLGLVIASLYTGLLLWEARRIFRDLMKGVR